MTLRVNNHKGMNFRSISQFIFYTRHIGISACRLSICLIVTLIGCGHSEKELSKDSNLLWEVATEAYEDGNWLEAKKYYERFTHYFPQHEHVGLAKLRVADSLYEQSKYFEAEVHYESFLELFPNHPEVSTAWYQLAQSQKEQVPGNVSRDLSKAVDAKKSYAKFLSLSKVDENHRILALSHVKDLDLQLMEKELEIGSWYHKLGHYKSAFMRFVFLIENYSYMKGDHVEDFNTAAVRMLDSAIELKDRASFQKAQKLIEGFKDSKIYKDALEEIKDQDISTWP
jgi:outer membrane assembly lipoprotein YfiO